MWMVRVDLRIYQFLFLSFIDVYFTFSPSCFSVACCSNIAAAGQYLVDVSAPNSKKNSQNL